MFIVMCQIDFWDEHTKREARINTSCMCLLPHFNGAQCHIHLGPVSPNARSDSFPCLSVWKSFPFLLFQVFSLFFTLFSSPLPVFSKKKTQSCCKVCLRS